MIPILFGCLNGVRIDIVNAPVSNSNSNLSGHITAIYKSDKILKGIYNGIFRKLSYPI